MILYLTLGVSVGTVVLYGTLERDRAVYFRELFEPLEDAEPVTITTSTSTSTTVGHFGLSWLKDLLKWLLKEDGPCVEGASKVYSLLLVIIAGLIGRHFGHDPGVRDRMSDSRWRRRAQITDAARLAARGFGGGIQRGRRIGPKSA